MKKIKFNPAKGLIVIPTRLYGPKTDAVVRLALDTGATNSIVNRDIAKLIGYDPATVEEQVRITTGSGVELASQIRVKKIEIMNRYMENFQILCHNLPSSATVDGVLGLDFFRGLRLVIDLKEGSITFD